MLATPSIAFGSNVHVTDAPLEPATSASAKRSASALSDKSSKSDTKARSSDTSQLSSDLDEGGKRNSVEEPGSVPSVLRDLKTAIICLEQLLSADSLDARLEQTRVSGYCGDLPAAVACPNDNGTS